MQNLRIKNLINILNNIKNHNEMEYNKTPYNKALNHNNMLKSWGLDIIPKNLQVDILKKYKTLNNKEVVITDVKLYNSINQEVTFPIKGFIILKNKNKKDKYIYTTWTLDGRVDVTDYNYINKYNLIEVIEK